MVAPFVQFDEWKTSALRPVAMMDVINWINRKNKGTKAFFKRTLLNQKLLDTGGGLINGFGLSSLFRSYSSHTDAARCRCSAVRTGGRGAPVATMNSAQREPGDWLWGMAPCSTMRLALLDWDI